MRGWIVICFALALAAQQIEFEAVSIKPGDPTAPGRMSQMMPGGFRARNIRLFELMMTAWHLNRDQIAGGPGWLETAGFDIDARFPAGGKVSDARQMIQAMLADRFQLVTHRETRTLPIYTLTVAKSGLKLKEGDGKGGMSAGPRMIKYSSGTMADLASQLTSYLGREVIDRTALTGQYAINLSFAPVDLSAAPEVDAGPSIFQALQEQAGLKLEATKGPVEILVIDRAEKPSAN